MGENKLYLVGEVIQNRKNSYTRLLVVECDTPQQAKKKYDKKYGTSYGFVVGVVQDRKKVNEHIQNNDHVFKMFMTQAITSLPETTLWKDGKRIG